MEYEEFYVIASKDKDGQWNKFAKAVDLPGLNAIPFFWDLEKAKYYFDHNIEKDLHEFFAIFKVTIGLDEVEKIV